MQSSSHLNQHDKIPIRLVSPGFGHLSADETDRYKPAARSPWYFFLFMISGNATHQVDMETILIQPGEMLLVFPHQLHEPPSVPPEGDYYKVGFDETTLPLLPGKYPFLLNTLNLPKISFSASQCQRIKSIFGILLELLSVKDTDTELVVAYLHSLLTEINKAYFQSDSAHVVTQQDFAQTAFTEFRLFVENNFADHPSVQGIAEQLAMNANTLNAIVKQHAGLSPKEYITRRLILEAQRRLHAGEAFSVKELAYDLGYNDPEYFSRIFRKMTGNTVSSFFRNLSGK